MDRRQYFRQFMIILTGNGAAQAVNLLSYPFLGRLYSPKEFGVFAMFVAGSAIVGAALYWHFSGKQEGFWLPILFGITVALTGITQTLSMFLMRHDRYRAQ